MNPEKIQLFIIISLCFPFLIPFLKKNSRLILIGQLFFGIIFLLFAFFHQHEFPIHSTFGGWEMFKGIEIIFSYDSFLFLLTTYVVFFAVVIVSFSKKREWKFYFLLGLLLADITCLFVANDLFNIYVTLELLSLLSYLLISIDLKKRQIWSSLKYMILGAVGFNLYLIGTSIIYGEIGTLNLTLLASVNYRNDFALMMIMIPLLIKSEVFFFSMWVPSAQTESENCISTILSAVVVNAGLFHLLRITNILDSQNISLFLVIVGLSTAFFGSVLSVFQKDIKMILAFSTMSHVGLVLIALSSNGTGYACSHSLYKTILFLCVGYYYQLYNTKNGENEKKAVPISLYLTFLVGFLSYSGMPFFIGSNFKYTILNNSNILISNFLKLISVISIFALSRILFLLKPQKNFFLISTYDFSLVMLASISIILGVITSLNYFSVQQVIEGILILLTGIVLYHLLNKKVYLLYPYKIFKLSSSLAVYSIIIAIIISISVIEIPLF